MKLQSRLDALERQSGTGLTHCVMWHSGLNFDEVLANSTPPANSSKRLLIEVVFVGMDRNPVPLTDEQQTEITKARAWAGELEEA